MPSEGGKPAPGRITVTGRLEGQVAVVTGAGRGIGRALALRLAGEGATLVVSSRTRADLDQLLADTGEAGPGSCAVVADARDRDGAKAPVRQAMERFGRVDVLVANVGGRPAASEEDGDVYTCSDDVFEQVVALNLLSTWWTIREALPVMRAQRYGRIITIGSGSAKRAGASAAYVAAKHGVVGLTRALALATGLDGITVNCLCPGWTLTGHNDWAEVGRRMGGIGAEEARDRAEAQNVQHRILEPDELGGMLVLLASPDGAGITGQVISVDGGYKL
jgi:NAD(P)-dependent dehydrogenase (short-subunit alcohol dehydrogenase family)